MPRLRRLDKRLEKGAHAQVLLQPFRVPLHRQPERVIGQLHPLHHPIGRQCGRKQARRQAARRLVVQAVDLHLLQAQNLRQPAARFNIDAMRQEIARGIRGGNRA